MKIIVTGGRKYLDREYAFYVLDQIHNRFPVTQLVEGGATGADSSARFWAGSHISPELLITCEADWHRYGNHAGRVRNCQMLRKHRPDLVVAFQGNTGTRHMVRISKEAGVPVIETWLPDSLQEFFAMKGVA